MTLTFSQCYTPPMWPFRRRERRKKRIMEKVVVGLIIGGAIGSIIGKKMMENHENEEGHHRHRK